MASEQSIGIAHNLYEMRRAARLFYGPHYAEEVAHMKEILTRVGQQQKTDVLQSAMWLGKRVDPHDLREMALIFAAAVETIEPSSSEPQSEERK